MTSDPQRRRRWAASYGLSLILHALAIVWFVFVAVDVSDAPIEPIAPSDVTVVRTEIAPPLTAPKPATPLPMKVTSSPRPVRPAVAVAPGAFAQRPAGNAGPAHPALPPRPKRSIAPAQRAELAHTIPDAEPQAKATAEAAPAMPAPVPARSDTAAAAARPSAAGEPMPAASAVPIVAPTAVAMSVPTFAPTQAPTAPPTTSPTAASTAAPTNAPTNAPTVAPTLAPTLAPTFTPTREPTVAPTPAAPTAAPTVVPTAVPTAVPTVVPSIAPTNVPTQPPAPRRTAAPLAVSPTPGPVATAIASARPATVPSPVRPATSAPPGTTAAASPNPNGPARLPGESHARPSANANARPAPQSTGPASPGQERSARSSPAPAAKAPALTSLNDRLKALNVDSNVDYGPKRVNVGDAQRVLDNAVLAYEERLAPPLEILKRTFGVIYQRRSAATPDFIEYVYDTYAIGPITMCKAWKIVEHPYQAIYEVGAASHSGGIGGAVATNANSTVVRHDNGGAAEVQTVQFPCSPKSYTAIVRGSLTTPLPRHPDLRTATPAAVMSASPSVPAAEPTTTP